MAPDERRRETAATPRWTVGECVSRVVLGIVVGTVLLASWLVVGVSLALLYTKGLQDGMGSLGAAVLAAPAVFVPTWKSWVFVRSHRGIVGALTGHLWVLNGSVGYAVLILAVLGVRDLLSPVGKLSWPLAVAGATGFVALFGGLVGTNFWLFRRWARRSPQPEPEAGVAAAAPEIEGQSP